jgi:hypothetical protein
MDVQKYRHRWLAQRLPDAAAAHPVVVLSGARQTGKSTLLSNERPFDQWTHLTLDDLGVRDLAARDPHSLWSNTDRVVIDEAQKHPDLLLAVKQAVDQDRSGRRFVLSGSAHLLLMSAVSESLAGRAVYFPLLPLGLGEAEQRQPPDWFASLFRGEPSADRWPTVEPVRSAELMARGFLPPLMTLHSVESIADWWEGYISTYLERDLRQLAQIDALGDFHRVMQMLALRSGQVINQTEICRDAGVSQPTVHRYINLLEASCLFEKLPSFSVNRTKRLTKRPKGFFIDSGLAAHLSGLHGAESVSGAREVGGLFESLVYLHLRILCSLMAPQARISYWRTTKGHEVDFVLEHGRGLVAIEVKMTTHPRSDDASHLRLFLQEYPETTAALVIHGGDEIRPLGDGIVAVPWTVLTGDAAHVV